MGLGGSKRATAGPSDGLKATMAASAAASFGEEYLDKVRAALWGMHIGKSRDAIACFCHRRHTPPRQSATAAAAAAAQR